MCLLYVLLVGGPLWWYASGQVDTVRTMGRGGPIVYLAVWLFVALLAWRHLRERSQRLPGGPLLSTFGALLAAYGVGLGLVFGLAFALQAVGTSHTAFIASLLLGGQLLLETAPLALLAAWLTRRWELQPGVVEERAVVAPLAAVAALLPLLVPVMAIWSVQWLPAPAFWAQRGGPEALSGTLYYALLPLMLPVAAIVAWGLDRALGVRATGVQATIAAGAFLLLCTAVLALPSMLHLLHEGAPALPPLDRYARALHGVQPFAGEGQGMPLAKAFRGVAAQLLLACALSVLALYRWRERSGGLLLALMLPLLPLQLLVSAVAVPQHGPAGAAWSGVAALLAIAPFVWLASPVAAPTAAAAAAAAEAAAAEAAAERAIGGGPVAVPTWESGRLAPRRSGTLSSADSTQAPPSRAGGPRPGHAMPTPIPPTEAAEPLPGDAGHDVPDSRGPEPRGLIVLDKPQGITSRKALNVVERRLDLGPLGHCGSLDPLATGVLVLVVGKARKVQDLIVRGEKVYDMTVTLGARSDTDDAEGEILPVEGAQPPSREQLETALLPFRGEIMQVPPTYSAVKVEGRRMHREARKGRPVEAPSRPVTVHELRLDRYEWPTLDLHLRCSSGTYARALARDLGASLGTGGYMSRLVRTHVGKLDLSQAVHPEAAGPEHVIGIEAALRDHPRIDVPLQQRSRLLRGQTLRTPPGFPIVEPCFAWCEGEVVATVTFVDGGTHYRTKKLLV